MSHRISITCCLLLQIGAAMSAPAFAERPNVVLILSDDQAWTDYGFMGHPQIRTPNLDQLARDSVLFRRGYVPTSLCRPSLLTIVTGLYAHQHGVTGNDPSPRYAEKGTEPYRSQRQSLINKIDQYATLPKILAGQDYRSHQSGKWWEGNFQRGGFTHGMTRGFPQPGGRHGDDGLKIGRQGLEPIEQFVDDSIADDKPFFLWYAPFLPHTPHTPPARLLEKYTQDNPLTIAKYYAMCEWFDESCGQLIEILEDRKLRDNTLIIYVTDNGWIQHPEKSSYDARSKQTPYEGGVRTPILFSWPGTLSPSDRNELVSSIDLFPTILSACGANSPTKTPGLDLWDQLKTSKEINRDTIFGEGFAHDIADINDPRKSLLYRWCIQGKWKLILTYDGEVNRYQSTHPRTEKGPQLFDLLSDPSESQNLAAANPSIVRRLQTKIESWRQP